MSIIKSFSKLRDEIGKYWDEVEDIEQLLYLDEMTKLEIRDALKAKGIFDKTGTRDPLWDQAFRLYHQETRRKLSQSCGSCYATLRNWLNS